MKELGRRGGGGGAACEQPPLAHTVAPATHHPTPVGAQGNVSRQLLAVVVVWGGAGGASAVVTGV
jgi:hypothetical protein